MILKQTETFQALSCLPAPHRLTADQTLLCQTPFRGSCSSPCSGRLSTLPRGGSSFLADPLIVGLPMILVMILLYLMSYRIPGDVIHLWHHLLHIGVENQKSVFPKIKIYISTSLLEHSSGTLNWTRPNWTHMLCPASPSLPFSLDNITQLSDSKPTCCLWLLCLHYCPQIIDLQNVLNLHAPRLCPVCLSLSVFTVGSQLGFLPLFSRSLPQTPNWLCLAPPLLQTFIRRSKVDVFSFLSSD